MQRLQCLRQSDGSRQSLTTHPGTPSHANLQAALCAAPRAAFWPLGANGAAGRCGTAGAFVQPLSRHAGAPGGGAAQPERVVEVWRPEADLNATADFDAGVAALFLSETAFDAPPSGPSSASSLQGSHMPAAAVQRRADIREKLAAQSIPVSDSDGQPQQPSARSSAQARLPALSVYTSARAAHAPFAVGFAADLLRQELRVPWEVVVGVHGAEAKRALEAAFAPLRMLRDGHQENATALGSSSSKGRPAAFESLLSVRLVELPAAMGVFEAWDALIARHCRGALLGGWELPDRRHPASLAAKARLLTMPAPRNCGPWNSPFTPVRLDVVSAPALRAAPGTPLPDDDEALGVMWAAAENVATSGEAPRAGPLVFEPPPPRNGAHTAEVAPNPAHDGGARAEAARARSGPITLTVTHTTPGRYSLSRLVQTSNESFVLTGACDYPAGAAVYRREVHSPSRAGSFASAAAALRLVDPNGAGELPSCTSWAFWTLLARRGATFRHLDRVLDAHYDAPALHGALHADEKAHETCVAAALRPLQPLGLFNNDAFHGAEGNPHASRMLVVNENPPTALVGDGSRARQLIEWLLHNGHTVQTHFYRCVLETCSRRPLEIHATRKREWLHPDACFPDVELWLRRHGVGLVRDASQRLSSLDRHVRMFGPSYDVILTGVWFYYSWAHTNLSAMPPSQADVVVDSLDYALARQRQLMGGGYVSAGDRAVLFGGRESSALTNAEQLAMRRASLFGDAEGKPAVAPTPAIKRPPRLVMLSDDLHYHRCERIGCAQPSWVRTAESGLYRRADRLLALDDADGQGFADLADSGTGGGAVPFDETKIIAAPMTIVPSAGFRLPDAARLAQLAALGELTYMYLGNHHPANEEAVNTLLTEVFPIIAARMAALAPGRAHAAKLVLVGSKQWASMAQRLAPAYPDVYGPRVSTPPGNAEGSAAFARLACYPKVPDLSGMLASTHVILAPVFMEGTGISTKVFFAIEHGMHLVTTSSGMKGVPCADPAAADSAFCSRVWVASNVSAGAIAEAALGAAALAAAGDETSAGDETAAFVASAEEHASRRVWARSAAMRDAFSPPSSGQGLGAARRGN